ncbi:porin [Vibrio sp. 1180_3]|uniref:porin n=1 Tax=Vibrio sp. 1180_3 TaxID=2528832 RepID=UPI002404F762|nr:porin [Vibrio sp. 1180_3]MDF9399977.1 porin [Vibrio sp. 1180_3]
MKKTLLALAVMAAAGSAQAGIELYNQDGVTVNLKGDIEVVYSNTTTESSMKQKIEDADFGFDVRYAVNDTWQVGAYWEFNGSKKTNSEVTRNGDTYVAAYHATLGSIKFGRLCTAVDDLGIGSDEAFGISTFLDNATDECSDEAVRYDFDNGDVYATLGFVQNKIDNKFLDNTKDVISDGNGDTYYDGRAGFRGLDNFDISVFASQYSVETETATHKDHTGFGSEIVFSGIENVNLAIAYYSVSSDLANDDNSVIAVAADYTMGKWGFAAGFSAGDHDDVAKEKDTWFVNTTYGVAPNTKLYAEVGGLDQKDVDDNLGLAIGVEASF